MNIFLVFNRFRSMTKKLCAPLTQLQLINWTAIANRFITPAVEILPLIAKYTLPSKQSAKSHCCTTNKFDVVRIITSKQ